MEKPQKQLIVCNGGGGFCLAQKSEISLKGVLDGKNDILDINFLSASILLLRSTQYYLCITSIFLGFQCSWGMEREYDIV